MLIKEKAGAQRGLSAGLFSLFALLLFAGALRIGGIRNKLFWSDELLTLVRVKGITYQDALRPLNKADRPIRAGELTASIAVPADQSLMEGLKGVLHSSVATPHLPLYYSMVRIWVALTGRDPALERGFSALLGCIGILLLWSVANELWQEQAIVGWIAACLMAASPYFVVYGEEARMYALLLCCILGSSLALLRYTSRDSAFSAAIYAIFAALGMLTHLTFLAVLAGQAVFIASQKIQNRSRKFLTVIACQAAAVAVASPWLIRIYHSPEFFGHYTNSHASGSELLQGWQKLIAAIICDIPQRLDFYRAAPVGETANWSAALLLLIGTGFLCVRSNRCAIAYVLWVFVAPAAGLLFLDLILGGHRSIIARYQLDFAVGAILILAWTLSELMRYRRFIGLSLLLVLLTVQLYVVSGGFSSNSWGKAGNGTPDLGAAAERLAALPGDAIIVNLTDNEKLLLMSRFLNPQITIMPFGRRSRSSEFMLDELPSLVRSGHRVVVMVDGTTPLLALPHIHGKRPSMMLETASIALADYNPADAS